MHVLLVPFGSHGDVHPFLGLGLKLRSSGRRVTFLINEYFGPLVRGLGFETETLGEAELFEQAMRDPDLWHPRKAFPKVLRAVHQHVALALPAARSRTRSAWPRRPGAFPRRPSTSSRRSSTASTRPPTTPASRPRVGGRVGSANCSSTPCSASPLTPTSTPA